ncbi:putative RND superfamily drug exporter [Mycolicibacterium fortuitum]|uniref:Putative RND superfamily drug exporter n=1 Tax=Mycolicibacterium fortuitum TaxID=1766 RepID=A0A378UBU2_MYCFO|nr:putative RND superfamily drug exporter [Mycolicibacterium fortuitum]
MPRRMRRGRGVDETTTGYSPALAAMTRFTIRHRWSVIAAWIALAAILAIVFPQLETVVKRQSVQMLPASMHAARTLDHVSTAFHEDGSRTVLFIAVEQSSGLTPQTRQRYDAMVDRLRADTAHVRMVQDLLADPATASHAVSDDGQAWYLPVGISGTLGDPSATESVNAVRSIVTDSFSGSPATARVTGPPATIVDQLGALQRDLLPITAITAAAIALILLLIYRSLFAALLPLITIGVSLVVTRGVLSGLGVAGVPISAYAELFVMAILLGAGTDYSVFLISRYHEQRRAGMSPDDSIVAATAFMGRVLLASAATVAIAFAAMHFTRLRALASIGPACSVGVMVGFAAAVTLLPPILSIAAGRGIGAPKLDVSRRYWNALAVTVVRRPRATLAISLVVLLALSGAAAATRLGYDDRRGQPSDTESNLAYQMLNRHFPADMVFSEYLVLDAPADMRTGKSLADLDQLASRIAQLPGVKKVSGVTRPTGERLEQAQLGWQNGRIGDQMAAAVDQARDHRDELTQLTNGADQLASGLTQLDDRLRSPLAAISSLMPQIADITSQLTAVQSQLNTSGADLDQILAQVHTIAPIAQNAKATVDTLDHLGTDLPNSPWCITTPQCQQIGEQIRVLVALRDNGFFDQISAFSDSSIAQPQRLRSLLDGLGAFQRAGGAHGSPQDIVGQIAQLQSGLGRLASGARALANGVHTLVDSNIQQLSGMSQVATQLQESARATTGADSSSGFFLPSDTFQRDDFARVARQFITGDGKTTRLLIESEFDPYSPQAVTLNHRIIETARAALPNTSLATATVDVAGFTAFNSELQQLMSADTLQTFAVTLIIVVLILIVLLRSIVAPLYLILTVVINFLAALGLTTIVFQLILGQDIVSIAPIMAFIILVAVGADYNMLLVSRLREESISNNRVAVIRTVANTGSVISSAGVIFAASMFGLLAGSVSLMLQIGFFVGAGLLIDTFIVRTLTVPAIATLLGKRNWWPGG